MTTRLKGLTVALIGDIREDDAEVIISAIKQIKGVLDVLPIETTHDDWINRQNIKNDLRQKLWDVLK